MNMRFLALLREPLTLFLLAGGGLFGLEAALNPPAGTSIVVPAPRVEAAQLRLQRELGRAPTQAELQTTLNGWIEDELLYQAALARDLGAGDPIIRRRLVQKMRLLLEQRAAEQVPDDAALQALLNEQPERYARPARYSFEHRYFSREQRGPDAAQVAQATLAKRDGPPPDAGDPFFAGQRFTGLSREEIRKLFGQDFARSLLQVPVADWQGPLPSGYGAHLVRITAIEPPQPADFNAIRPTLLRDWQERQRQAVRQEILAEWRRALRIEWPTS